MIDLDFRDWKNAAIDWFSQGKATDEQWEEMAEALLDRSEDEGLTNRLDNDIFLHACSKGATPNQFGDSIKIEGGD